MTPPREKLVKIGAKVVRLALYPAQERRSGPALLLTPVP